MALRIHTNGGSQGNLGPSTIAWVVCDQIRNVLNFASMFLPQATNNEPSILQS